MIFPISSQISQLISEESIGSLNKTASIVQSILLSSGISLVRWLKSKGSRDFSEVFLSFLLYLQSKLAIL